MKTKLKILTASLLAVIFLIGSSSATMAAGIPIMPPGCVSAGKVNDEVKLSWLTPMFEPEVAAYKITLTYPDYPGETTFMVDGDQTSFSHAGTPTGSQVYRYTIQTGISYPNYGLYFSEPSESVDVSAQSMVSHPCLSRDYSFQGDGISLSWTKPIEGYAENYFITRLNPEGDVTEFFTVGHDATSFVDQTFTPNKQGYRYFVQAGSGKGSMLSAWSNIITTYQYNPVY